MRVSPDSFSLSSPDPPAHRRAIEGQGGNPPPLSAPDLVMGGRRGHHRHMSDEPAKRRICSIDRDPKKNEWVARRHMEGYTLSAMERMSREAGIPMKRETIGRHLRECLNAPDASPVEVAKTADKVIRAYTPPSDRPSEDVAVLVQRKVIEKLKKDEARVTVQHGLSAQQLLDRRAERQKDRELAITLARMLHSSAPPPRAIRSREAPTVIEGEATKVIESEVASDG